MKGKKVIACIFACIMTMSIFAACTKGVEISEATTGNIKVTVVDKGYDTEWLYALKDVYEQKYKDCTVEIVVTSDSSAVASKIRSNANDSDLVITAGALSAFHSEQNDGYLLELTDVYETVQDGYDVPAKDRMNKSVRSYYETDEGKFYQIPWVLGYSGLLYNKSVIDEALGDSYTLPRTTNELYEFCADLKEAGVTPFALSTAVSYWNYLMVPLYYQYVGSESYDKFNEGYFLQDGTWTKASESNFADYLNSQIGVKKAAEVVYNLLSDEGEGTGDFGIDTAQDLSFQQAQELFCGSSVNGKKIKCAFLFSGDWFGNEMKSTIERNNADIRFMRMPVLSSITETLEKEIDETTLRKVVDAIDAGEISYAGMSANDFARIKTARFSACSPSTSHAMAIPKMKNGTRKYALTKQFLNFILSKDGQEMFTYTLNGITMPFGYTAEGVYGAYADSLYYAMGDATQFNAISEGHNSPLFFIAGLDIVGGYYEGYVYDSDMTPAEYFNNRLRVCNQQASRIIPLIR